MTEKEKTVLDHAEELRNSFLRVFFIILTGFIISLFFYQPVIEFLTSSFSKTVSNAEMETITYEKKKIWNHSLQSKIYTVSSGQFRLLDASKGVKQTSATSFTLPKKSFILVEEPSHPQLYLFSPFSGLSTMISVSFIVGFTLSAPFWLFLIAQFCLPAMKREERKVVVPFFVLSFVFFPLGAFLGFSTLLPLANSFLFSFNASIGQNLWALQDYLQYALLLIFSGGVAAEIGLLLLLLVHFEVLTPEQMKKQRKFAIVTAFILGALLTPPDILSQICLAGLFIGIYELAIGYGHSRKKWAGRSSNPLIEKF